MWFHTYSISTVSIQNETVLPDIIHYDLDEMEGLPTSLCLIIKPLLLPHEGQKIEIRIAVRSLFFKITANQS
jgi:hypothetical protein